MSVGIFVTTVSADVFLRDLGKLLVHPLVDYELSAEFTESEISSSVDFNNAVSGGTITVEDGSGNPITSGDLENGVGTHSHTNKLELDLITDGDHDVRTDNPHGVTATQVGIDDTGDISEGSNLYYTEGRVSANTDVSANTSHRNATGNPHSVTTTDIPEGTNEYYTELKVSANSNVLANTTHRGRTDNPHSVSLGQLGLTDTDNVPEGSTNLYYTEGRVNANSDVGANTSHRNSTGNPHSADTDDIPEGSTNEYYTEAKVSANSDVSANTTHRGQTDNPHSVSKTQVGLSNVTNDAQLKRAANDISTFTEKTSLVDDDLLLIEDSENSGNKKKVKVASLLPVFGTEYNFARSDSESSSNSSSWQEKLVLTLTSMPEGVYHIEWYYEWRCSSTGRDFMCDISLDFSYDISSVNIEAKDNTSWHGISGNDEINLNGNHNIYISYKPEATNATAYIRRARLKLWRIS